MKFDHLSNWWEEYPVNFSVLIIFSFPCLFKIVIVSLCKFYNNYNGS